MVGVSPPYGAAVAKAPGRIDATHAVGIAFGSGWAANARIIVSRHSMPDRPSGKWPRNGTVTTRLRGNRDAPAFAAALSDLVAMPADARQARGERARARMQIEFDIRRVAARYDELWYALAAGERPCA